ncbi:MAG TPA: hypothetical protein PK637_02750 [Flavobacteriales bacterium]|nr:hypothetical protein [Flavobacteriales bacterium]HRE73758.1 hypothetical protein [Flavobacteriales bacterium]HRE95654.1 hypothetical protein [Flavobacteriales bacterium]HRJ35342.1 hypothetical protein [Flavobacteriales bacterium]HRJ39700.1 hypothetical protein [Flavobacteriales bacterium]
MKHFLLLLHTICITYAIAQSPCSTPENYIPSGDEPEVIVRVKLHVVQYSKTDPRNYTEKDTAALKQQFDLINLFYNEMEAPTLKPTKEVDHLRSARIRFQVVEIRFHQDERLWDRIGLHPAENRQLPAAIDSISSGRKEIWIAGNHMYRIGNKKAQFRREGMQHLDMQFDTAFFHREKKMTKIIFRESVPVEYAQGKITFYMEEDKNCHDDLFHNLAQSDSSYLHVFYTGASARKMAFGCGPSPYYLNVSNYTNGGEWANAQLSAHELGHCVGLSHTDFPQFDDLPKKDKFGFIDCDSIEVSNNIMGYNKCRRYLSPKQIAWVHQEYSLKPYRIRTTAYCTYNPQYTWTIRKNTTWNRAMVIGGDLVIRKGKTLTVNCMVSLPEGAHIILEEGAKLILNGNVITNNCGGTWNGVLYCRKFSGDKSRLKPVKKKKGNVQLQNGGRFERMQQQN